MSLQLAPKILANFRAGCFTVNALLENSTLQKYPAEQTLERFPPRYSRYTRLHSGPRRSSQSWAESPPVEPYPVPFRLKASTQRVSPSHSGNRRCRADRDRALRPETR
jgi:hypothetical protein